MYKIELPFYPYSHHLDQLYTGLELLKEKKIIEVKYHKNYQPYNKINIVKARVNGKYDVVYDLFDSTDWLLGETEEKNISFFHEHLKCDFYFKRSFNKTFHNRISNYSNVMPFGFNYPVNVKHILKHRIVNGLKELIDYPVFHRYFSFNTHSVGPREFEHLPVPNAENRIIFLVRLWNPEGVTEKIESKEISNEREQINITRVNCIRACKNEFGNLFLGGVQDIPFSRKYCPELILPRYVTSRRSYLKSVKDSNICVATTGLHGSTGWKFAEYIAAARAIVTEQLNFEVPGEFVASKNYFTFDSPGELIDKILYLTENREIMKNMMLANYQYYQAYLRPDIIVLNTLLQIPE